MRTNTKCLLSNCFLATFSPLVVGYQFDVTFQIQLYSKFYLFLARVIGEAERAYRRQFATVFTKFAKVFLPRSFSEVLYLDFTAFYDSIQ